MRWFSRNPKITILYLILFLSGLLSLGSMVSSSPEQDTIPSFNNDLLYLNVETGNLMIWRAGTAEPEVLVGQSDESQIEIDGRVVSYTASDDGHILALVVERSDESYEILWLDLLAMELESIGEFSNLPEVKISPNGKWLAYREEETEEIFAVDLYEPGEKTIVGICNEVMNHSRTLTCGPFYWSPNSAQLAWSDGIGLWVAQPPRAAKKVLNNYILQKEYKGEEDLIRSYGIHSWSPGSRYLVLNRSVFIEGGDKVLFDINGGKLVYLPNTYEYAGYHPVLITWLGMSRLSIISGYSAEIAPRANIWSINPKNSDLLVQEGRFDVGSLCSIVTDTGLIEQNRVYYTILYIPVWDDGNCQLEVDNGLYFATSPGSYKSLAVEFPEPKSDYNEFAWSPDFDYAVLYLEESETGGSFYVDFLDVFQATVEDLTPFIGESKDVCCFTWVE